MLLFRCGMLPLLLHEPQLCVTLIRAQLARVGARFTTEDGDMLCLIARVVRGFRV